MEANDGPTVLFVLGLLGIALGIFSGDWFLFNFVYVGISWIIAGAILKFAERDLTEGAFLAGLVFGVVGAIIWMLEAGCEYICQKDNLIFLRKRK